MSQPGDVTVISTLSIQNNAPAAIARSTDILGNFQFVADHASRDALASWVRVQGMVVYTLNDGNYWQLVGGIANVNWAPANFGGGTTYPVAPSGGVYSPSAPSGGIAVGNTALASGDSAIALGGAQATSFSDIAIGSGNGPYGAYATASGGWSIAIGNTALTTAPNAIAIGSFSGGSTAAGSSNSIAIGAAAQALSIYGAGGIVIGSDAITGGVSSVVIGYLATDNSSSYATVVGTSSQVSADYGTVFGQNSTAGYNSVTVGPFIGNSGQNSVVIGANISNSQNLAVIIGQGAGAAAPHAVTIGAAANSHGADETVVVGYGATVSTDCQNSVSIGFNAWSPGISTVIGHYAQAAFNQTGYGGMTLIGEFARSGNSNYVTAVGQRVLIGDNSDNSVALGDHVSIVNGANSSVVIGSHANVTSGGGSVVIGEGAGANNTISVVLGQFANSNGYGSLAMGFESTAQFDISAAFGIRGYTTAAHQWSAGHINYEFNDVYFGGGTAYAGAPFKSYAAPIAGADFTLHGTDGFYLPSLGAPTNPPALIVVPNGTTLTVPAGTYFVGGALNGNDFWDNTNGSTLVAGDYYFASSYLTKDATGESPISPSAFVTIADGDAIVIYTVPNLNGGNNHSSGTYESMNIYLGNPLNDPTPTFQQMNGTFGGGVMIAGFAYGNVAEVVDSTGYDGSGYKLKLAGGKANVGGTGGNIELYTGRTPDTLTLATYLDAPTGTWAKFGLSTVSVSGTVLLGDAEGYLFDTSAGPGIAQLPDATTNPGAVYDIKRVGAAFGLSIAPTVGGQTIETLASFPVASDLDSITVRAVAGNWWIF